MDKKFIAAKEVTPDMIAEWKRLHGSVFQHTTIDGKTAYFKKPDLKVLDASAAMAGTNPLQSNKVIAENCFLAGDREILESQDHFLGLSDKLKTLIKKVQGELLEL